MNRICWQRSKPSKSSTRQRERKQMQFENIISTNFTTLCKELAYVFPSSPTIFTTKLSEFRYSKTTRVWYVVKLIKIWLLVNLSTISWLNSKCFSNDVSNLLFHILKSWLWIWWPRNRWSWRCNMIILAIMRVLCRNEES